MLAPDWTWWTSVPVILAALALLWVPGTTLALGLGAGRWPSIALAPVLTSSLISLGGIVLAVMGVGWGFLPLLVVALGVPLVVLGARWIVTRAGRILPRLDVPPPPMREVVLGGAIAAVVAVVTIVRGVGLPGDIPQQPDVSFHLGLVRYFLESATISSLGADGFTDPESPSFYPAGFHGVAASLVMATGAPVVVAEHALLVINSAVVWPLGLMFLVSVVLRDHSHVVLLSGVLSSVVPSFPFYLWVWGPLWPLHFGFSQIPAVLVVVALLLQRWGEREVHWSAALLVLAALPGLTLAHTSATITALVGGVALALATSSHRAGLDSRTGWRRWAPLAFVTTATVLGILALAYLAPVGMKETSYDRVPLSEALVGLFSLWASHENLFQFAGGAVLILVLLGSWSAFRLNQGIWVVGTWVFFAGFGFLTSVLDAHLTWPFTWPWYNLPVRMQAVAALFAVPLAAMGVSWLWSRGRNLFARLALVVGVAFLVGIQVHGSATSMRFVYEAPNARAWIDREEADALRAFSVVMPDDAVVAVNPWRGAHFLYQVGPEEPLSRTEKSIGQDLEVITRRLEQIEADPEVCEAVQRQGVSFAITGGESFWTERREPVYAGIDGVSEEEGFEIVARTEPYTLWRVPDCQP